MKPMRLWISVLFVLAIASTAVSVAFAQTSQKPKHAVKAKAAHVAQTRHAAAAKSGGEPAESAGEAAGSTETDGIDAGGDHQCPPACAPGENP